MINILFWLLKMYPACIVFLEQGNVIEYEIAPF